MVKEKLYKQITCIERWDDNAQYFDPLITSIKAGKTKEVVEEMKSWNALSDLDDITYEKICDMALRCNERIVYDDFNYLLSANEDIIVLYKEIKENN